MQEILDAILTDEHGAIGGLDLPDHYRGITVHADETDMFAGIPSRDKDPRKSLHLDEVPTPELAPGEAIVAVMASAINYNTVWTSIFEPLSTFGFLERSGPGIQQMAYRVVDIDASCATLREQGLRLLYDEPRRGTAGSRINFVHPRDAGGVLVELVEPASEPDH